MSELEQALTKYHEDMTGLVAKANQEIATLGAAQTETKEALAAIQTQLNAVDEKMQRQQTSGSSDKSLKQILEETDSLKRLAHDKKGIAAFALEGRIVDDLLMNRKTTVTTSAIGYPTSGVMPEERGRFVEEARRPLRVRDVIPARPTTFGQIYWPKVNLPMTKASPVTEANAKPENRETFTVVTENVQTIATWIPASRQAIEDWSELEGILRGALAYQVNKEEDRQFLAGSGAAPDLNGLLTQATTYDTTLLTASDGYEYIDHIAAAAQQVDEADELSSTFAIVHPGDLWKMRRTKDSTGQYILAGPAAGGMERADLLWGIRLIPTTAITKGTFLVGNGSPAAAEIRDRMSLEIVISTEHASYFTSNLIAIRAEKRCCICCYRPACFITGSFTQSPA